MSVGLRVARPTNDLRALERFYVEGAGLAVRSRFEGHDGFDGLILAADAWEVEFVVDHHAPAPRAPTAEHLLVLSLAPQEVEARATRLDALGFARVTPNNPWWSRHGVTFEDPDGYHFVLARRDAPQPRPLPEGVRLRDANERDVPALIALHAQVWDERTTPTGSPPPPLDPQRRTFVAERDGAVVGAVQLGPRSPYASNTHVGVLTWLAVRPDQQHLGVGRALSEHVIAAARQQGLRKLALSVLGGNEKAVALYRSLGFQLEARREQEFLLGGRFVDSLEFAMELSFH